MSEAIFLAGQKFFLNKTLADTDIARLASASCFV